MRTMFMLHRNQLNRIFFNNPAHIKRRLTAQSNNVACIYESFYTLESIEQYICLASEYRNLIHQHVLHSEPSNINSSNTNTN
jgi:hypothetical protein